MTESFKDYTRKTLLKEYSTLDAFTRRWQAAERKQAIMDELAQAGVLWEVLSAEVVQDLDPFDLICHVVYDQPPLARRERADNVKKRMLCSTAYLWPSYDNESLPQVASIKPSQSCAFVIAPW